MKIVIKYIAAVIFGLVIVSCSDDDNVLVEALTPTSDFSFESTLNSPQLISFTNISENAESFEWNFGDGSETTFEKHPSHNYIKGGIYTVSLKGINQNKEDILSQDITVLGNPIADFSYVINTSTDFTIDFQNLSQSTSTYIWDFGDGSDTSSEENPSHTFNAEGNYIVTLTGNGDSGSNTVSMEIKVTQVLPAYNNIYIVGDGSPSGWNIASPQAFVQNSTNPFVFTFEGLLTAGEFKISTFSGDWCDGDWINPPQNGNDITNDNFITTNGCDGPDNKWVVTNDTKGRYLITIDLSNNTILFKKQFPPYSNLYIVGDASPSGWNIASPEAFTQSTGDPFLFTYQAALTFGEFKISTFTGDWCDGNWINPPQNGDEITGNPFIITTNCDGPDNKWSITSGKEGTYLISINLYDGTINFELQ